MSPQEESVLVFLSLAFDKDEGSLIYVYCRALIVRCKHHYAPGAVLPGRTHVVHV